MTMTTPAEVKFRLEKQLVDLVKDDEPVPVITGVHSIVMIDSTTVSAIFRHRARPWRQWVAL